MADSNPQKEQIFYFLFYSSLNRGINIKHLLLCFGLSLQLTQGFLHFLHPIGLLNGNWWLKGNSETLYSFKDLFLHGNTSPLGQFYPL